MLHDADVALLEINLDAFAGLARRNRAADVSELIGAIAGENRKCRGQGKDKGKKRPQENLRM